jgi:hypothetical protein
MLGKKQLAGARGSEWLDHCWKGKRFLRHLLMTSGALKMQLEYTK